MNTLHDDSIEKKQETSRGYEIRIPKKGGVFVNLEKSTESNEKPVKKSDSARRSGSESGDFARVGFFRFAEAILCLSLAEVYYQLLMQL